MCPRVVLGCEPRLSEPALGDKRQVVAWLLPEIVAPFWDCARV